MFYTNSSFLWTPVLQLAFLLLTASFIVCWLPQVASRRIKLRGHSQILLTAFINQTAVLRMVWCFQQKHGKSPRPDDLCGCEERITPNASPERTWGEHEQSTVCPSDCTSVCPSAGLDTYLGRLPRRWPQKGDSQWRRNLLLAVPQPSWKSQHHTWST